MYYYKTHSFLKCYTFAPKKKEKYSDQLADALDNGKKR